MWRPQFTFKTMLWLMALVWAFGAGYEVARKKGEAQRCKVLDELITDRRVLENRRYENNQLLDQNRQLIEMLRIEKRRTSGTTDPE